MESPFPRQQSAHTFFKVAAAKRQVRGVVAIAEPRTTQQGIGDAG